MVLLSMEFLLFSTMKNQLLIVERSYLWKQACTIKVYLCDFSNATDVKNSLQRTDFTPASKKLILNMDNLGIYRQY
jgi:hypothetical protein